MIGLSRAAGSDEVARNPISAAAIWSEHNYTQMRVSVGTDNMSSSIFTHSLGRSIDCLGSILPRSYYHHHSDQALSKTPEEP